MIKFPDGDELEVMQIGQRKLTMVRDAEGVWIEVRGFEVLNKEARYDYINYGCYAPGAGYNIYNAKIGLTLDTGQELIMNYRLVRVKFMTDTQALSQAFGDLVDVVKELGRVIWEVMKG